MVYINRLWNKHAKFMVQLTYRRVGDPGLAEDLVQETFLIACCKVDYVAHHEILQHGFTVH